ncbi:hypothetical protein CRE_13854 [Caenorhabditis remanei]|uniref:F-box domain-containing protein n=1 Tax=Caenorhabditis remanei TaxID=31234 RepID=E3NUG9_CAERE|nr:hypothetical protein CRE_13854 [Caenorhabditis remanei]
MAFIFALLFCWIISVFFEAIESFLIPNIPLPPLHFPPSQTVSIRQPDVSVPTPPFLLLHIPYLPLGRIIDFMEPKTLVSLSFCSQKTHSVIKTQRRAPFAGRLCVSELDSNLSFRTFGNNNCVLSVRDCSYFSSSERSDYVIIKGQYVPVEVYRSKGNLVSYWYNTTDGLKTITDYVTDLFNIDVSEVCVSKDAINLIEWAIRRQKTPLDCLQRYIIRRRTDLYFEGLSLFSSNTNQLICSTQFPFLGKLTKNRFLIYLAWTMGYN